jgi:hypothetical protein
MVFWLHGFEEPLDSQRELQRLARSTLFKEGQTRFVGVLCCLALSK